VEDRKILETFLSHLKDSPKAIDLLISIWLKEEVALGLSGGINDKIAKIFDLVFSPYRRKSSLLREIRRLPPVRFFEDVNRDGRTLLDSLENKGLLLLFSEEEECVTLTPEGVAIALLAIKHGRDFLECDRTCLDEVTQLNLLLYDHYRKHSMRQIQAFTLSMRGQRLLGVTQLSITLFLLVNGSIGKARAFSIESSEAQNAAEEIIRSFVQDPRKPRKRVYPFNWYLTTAKKLMGDVFYNRYPLYYIYEDKVETVKGYVKTSVKRIGDFDERWHRLLNEYEKCRSVLRFHGVSYFSRSEVMELEQRLFL
jgi:hypothetical protein